MRVFFLTTLTFKLCAFFSLFCLQTPLQRSSKKNKTNKRQKSSRCNPKFEFRITLIRKINLTRQINSHSLTFISCDISSHHLSSSLHSIYFTLPLALTHYLSPVFTISHYLSSRILYSRDLFIYSPQQLVNVHFKCPYVEIHAHVHKIRTKIQNKLKKM